MAVGCLMLHNSETNIIHYIPMFSVGCLMLVVHLSVAASGTEVW